jgi:hypothetical protein
VGELRKDNELDVNEWLVTQDCPVDHREPIADALGDRIAGRGQSRSVWRAAAQHREMSFIPIWPQSLSEGGKLDLLRTEATRLLGK